MSTSAVESNFSISLTQMLDLTFGRADNQPVNLKMLQNFLHVLLHLNGFNATVVDYQGEAADEMRALASSSCQSELRESEGNVAKIPYKISKSPRKNDNADPCVEATSCIEKLRVVDETTVSTNKNILQPQLLKTSQKSSENNKIKRLAGGGDIAEEVSEMHKKMSQIENQMDTINEHMSHLTNQPNESKDNNSTITDINKNKDDPSEKQSVTVASSNLTLNNVEPTECEVLGNVDCCKLRTDIRTIQSALTEVKQDVCCIRQKIYTIAKSCESKEKDSNCKKSGVKTCTIPSDNANDENYLIIKQKPDTYKPTKCTDLICNIETSLKSTIESLEERLQNFEDYVNCSLRNINEIISKSKSEEELIKYVQSTQSELDCVKADVCQLKCNEAKTNLQLDAINEEICLLRTTKVDHEAFHEALAEKANVYDLNKKVSCEHFDAVCEDFTRSINEIIAKLSEREAYWQQMFGKLRNEFQENIDNLEMPALKDYINCQLHMIKGQLAILSQMKQEQESAGGKKVLRNMRCIVCNNDVFMKTNSKLTVGSEPFPCRTNTKPYLDLKMARENPQRKMIFPDKNCLHLEKIMNPRIEKSKSPCKENYENTNQMKDHPCDRYCGGSHTVLSPQKKVLKKADNDDSLWREHDSKLVEGFVKGTDGQMYRGRWSPEPNAVDIATGRT